MNSNPTYDKVAASKLINDQLTHVYVVNLNRVSELVKHSRSLLEEEDANINEVAFDILRAAVVLIHSTLEDFLRSVASVLLPYREEKTLGEFFQDKKISLGKLVACRERSVQEFIQGYVNATLNGRSYNNTNAISDLLGQIGVDPGVVRPIFSELTQLMERRHQIAHKADIPEDVPVPISPEQVEQWVNAVSRFVDETLGWIAKHS